MYLTKEKFEEIKERHGALIVSEEDVSEALTFVQELLEAEADALTEGCPYATNTIKRMEAAAYEIFSMSGEISSETFDEGADDGDE